MLHKISQMFQIERMSASFLRFANSYFCFQIAEMLSSIFVSTFLFVSGGEMSTIAIYHLFYYGVEAVAIWLTVRLAHRVDSRKLTMFGIGVHLSAYLILLIAQEKTISFYPVVGFLSGLGSGFFWNSYYTLIQCYTDTDNRQISLSYVGIISNLITLIAPSLSGMILVVAPGKWSYIAIFAIAALFFSSSIWITRKLSAVEKRPQRSSIFSVIREFWKDKVINCLIVSEVLRGLRSGLIAYYFNILILAMTSNEFVIGATSTLKGAAAMLIYYILGRKYIDKNKRFVIVIVSTVVGIFATSSLFLWFTATAMVVYSIVDNSVNVLIDNNLLLTQSEIAEYTSKKRDLRLENSAIRLLSLEVGRLVGIVISMILPIGGKAVILFFVILAALNIPVWAIYKYASKICEGDKA